MQAYVCSIDMYYTKQYKNIFCVCSWNMNDYTNVFVSCLSYFTCSFFPEILLKIQEHCFVHLHLSWSRDCHVT